MSLFDLFKKKEQKMDIFDIPYDYDGYDFMYKSSTTNPMLYRKINEIITNGRYDIIELEEYNEFIKDSNEARFNIFYEVWIESLRKKGFMIHLDNQMGIEQFAKQMNVTLEQLDADGRINENVTINRYNEELKNYSMRGEQIRAGFIYDVLEANIAAGELRKIGYELICLFNGFDNNIKTIISIDRIAELKEIEAKIKE